MAQSARRLSPDALIVDMDGLLIDTERVDRDAFEQACRDVGWESPDMKTYADCIGTTGPDVEAILRKGYGPDFPWAVVRDTWRQRYIEYFQDRPADVKPGAGELLSYAAQRGIPCGVATSTQSPLAALKLGLSGLDGHFSVVVTGDDVRRGKPHPEPYVTAARRLGVCPDRCWALEDSANGVRSALAAGCQVFQVPDLVDPSPELRQLGHQIVETLHDVLRALKKTRVEELDI